MTEQASSIRLIKTDDEWAIHLNDGVGEMAAVLTKATVADLRADFLAGEGVIPLDDLTARLIETARHLEAMEPQRPDLDRHTGHHLEAIARRWDEWDRKMGAYHALIGWRLTRSALKG